jgi:DNA-3-methyladenine glycosylase II
MNRLDRSAVQRALFHLRKADPTMRRLIGQVGPFELELQRNRFHVLVKSIIAQQISTKAAVAIRTRVEKLAGPGRLTAEKLAAVDFEDLRAAGLSRQKAAYLHDLAEKVRTRRVRMARLARMSDEDVIDELAQVKGIGRWTAQMFLIFSLGRPDVFPHDDLGIRKAIQNLYGLDDLPDKQTSLEIAAPWSPYASIASWYCWRSIDAPDADDW